MELQTHFGRHEETLGDLETLLLGYELPQHSALVVGVGLDQLPVFEWLQNDVKAKQPFWLQQKYSWEYLEVAAVLERLGKPWTLTVVDSSPEVCEAVQRQEVIVIDDAYGKSGYAKRFLETLGVGGYDDKMLRTVSTALESSKILNRVEVCNEVNIPSAIREKITVICGGIQNLGELALLHDIYDVITVFNVFQHIPDFNDKTKAGHALGRRVSEKGIIVADLKFYGFPQIRTPRVNEYKDYGPESELITHTYITYFMGKPKALSAEAPLRV
mgnify:CR=1 FL=1